MMRLYPDVLQSVVNRYRYYNELPYTEVEFYMIESKYSSGVFDLFKVTIIDKYPSNDKVKFSIFTFDLEGRYHNPYDPAVMWSNGLTRYYYHGLLHRDHNDAYASFNFKSKNIEHYPFYACIEHYPFYAWYGRIFYELDAYLQFKKNNPNPPEGI